MILCDPFAINTLSLSAVRHLQELVGQETLPRVRACGCRAAFRVGTGWWPAGGWGRAALLSTAPHACEARGACA